MRRILSILAACTLFASSAAAEEKADNATNESNIVSPLKKGQAAPFSGVLFSQRAAATIVTDLKAADERIKIEVAAAVKAAEARKQFELDETKSRCKSDASVAAADIEEKRKRIDLLESELKTATTTAPNRMLWAGLGAVGGIVLTVVTVFAVNQVAK